MSKVPAVPELWFLGGCSVVAVGFLSSNGPLGITGGIVAVVSLSVLLSGSTWVRSDAERQRSLRSSVAARGREPTIGERATALPRTPPTIGAHVLDGTRTAPLGPRVVRALMWSAVLLAAGVVALASELVVVGIVLLILGSQVAIVNLGMAVKVRRHGVTWPEGEDRAWPSESHVGEIVEVWEEDAPGVPWAHGFWLRVHAPAGPWEIRTRQGVPEPWLNVVRPGQTVTVRADPEDPIRVAIDWSASSPPA